MHRQASAALIPTAAAHRVDVLLRKAARRQLAVDGAHQRPHRAGALNHVLLKQNSRGVVHMCQQAAASHKQDATTFEAEV